MSGCGIILYTKKYGKTRYLALEVDAKMALASGGKWDLPKGTKNPNESNVDCAIRETAEETSISISPQDISNDSFTMGPLTMFYAETNKDPVITPNPESGIIEHTSYKWMTDVEIYANCFLYLKPFVKWISAKNL